MQNCNSNNCKNCNDIPKILASIDCKLAELGNNLYNNISYLLNKNNDICNINKLLIYKDILITKNNNSKYLSTWCFCTITTQVKKITIGCIGKCFKPQDCYSKNYELLNKNL